MDSSLQFNDITYTVYYVLYIMLYMYIWEYMLHMSSPEDQTHRGIDSNR